MERKLRNIISQKVKQIAAQLTNEDFRKSFMESNVKMSVATQIRALRGDKSQAEFGRMLNQTQSVVSRFEDPDYGKWTLQTLLGVVTSLDLALVVKIVDYPTFLRSTSDYDRESLAPESYKPEQIISMEELAPETFKHQQYEVSVLGLRSAWEPVLNRKAEEQRTVFSRASEATMLHAQQPKTSLSNIASMGSA